MVEDSLEYLMSHQLQFFQYSDHWGSLTSLDAECLLIWHLQAFFLLLTFSNQHLRLTGCSNLLVDHLNLVSCLC